MSAMWREDLRSIIAKAKDGALVQQMQVAFELLQKEGLCYVQRISSSLIGVARDNRDGTGIMWKDVYKLLGEISKVGYNAQCTNNICVEVEHGDQATLAFNERLSKMAGGRLPPLAATLRYASLSGSHLNVAFKCLLSEIEIADEESVIPVLCHDKRLSLEKLKMLDKRFYQAVTEGMEWRVISSIVCKEFPDFAQLVQASANCAQHLAKPEADLQLMKRMSSMIASSDKDSLSFNDIQAALLRSRPLNASAAPRIFGFLMAYSGGKEGKFFAETELFIRGEGMGSRLLPVSIYEALQADGRPSSNPFLLLRHALLKVLHCGPEAALSHADVKKALRCEKAVAVEKLLAEVSKYLQKAPACEKGRSLLGRCEMDLAWTMMEKRDPSGYMVKYEQVEQAAHAFALRLMEETGVQLESPWREAANKALVLKSTAASAASPKQVAGAKRTYRSHAITSWICMQKKNDNSDTFKLLSSQRYII